MCLSAWRKYFYYCTFRIGQIIVNSAIEFRVHKPEIIEEHFCVMSICWPSTFGKHHPLLGCWPKNRPNPLTPSNWQCVERTIFCRIVDFGPTSCSQLFEYASILFDCSSMRLFDYSSVHYVVVWQRSTDILLSSHELYLGMPAWKSCQAAVRAACAGPGYQLPDSNIRAAVLVQDLLLHSIVTWISRHTCAQLVHSSVLSGRSEYVQKWHERMLQKLLLMLRMMTDCQT